MGGEYSNKNFNNFCDVQGISVQYTVERNPEQNGLAERYNRTLLNKARYLIFDSKMEKKFWGEAVLTSTYLLNRTETSTLPKGVTPAEIWFGVKPDLSKIRIFGCSAFAHIPKEDRISKLDPCSKKMYFVGYCPNGYRLWNPFISKVIYARSVIFYEFGKNNFSVDKIEDVSEEEESGKV